MAKHEVKYLFKINETNSNTESNQGLKQQIVVRLKSCLGDKSGLKEAITEVADIPEVALERFRPESYRAADKIKRAEIRQTTRKEDQAYCLLGLFGMNLPLLYGEDDHAFRRLQRAILEQSSDYTVSGWSPDSKNRQTDVLADSPPTFTTKVLWYYSISGTTKSCKEERTLETTCFRMSQQQQPPEISLSFTVCLVPLFNDVYFVPTWTQVTYDAGQSVPRTDLMGMLVLAIMG